MKTKKLVVSALFAALTCVTTMIIKIPTPTMGYIHPGDAMVVLSGVLLGPVWGALAAGIGSAFSDLFSGYLTYAPATFVIKYVTALIAAVVAKALKNILDKANENKANAPVAVLIGGLLGEAFMVLGYYLFEIFLLGLAAGDGLTTAAITAGIVASAEGIPFNIVQGVFGAVLGSILYPVLKPLLKEYYS